MSKLEELIESLCPDGVEFKQLWEVTIWDKRFQGVEKHKQPKTIKYNVLLANELNDLRDENGSIRLLYTGSGDEYFTTEEKAGNNICQGEIVAIPWGGTPRVQYYNGKFVTGDNRIATSIDVSFIDSKFIYYWLSNKIDELSGYYRGSGIQHPSMKSVLDMKLPVPPLEVQQEIVRILDTFTALEAELEAELEARKTQYSLYRSKLILNNNSFKNMKLGEIASFSYGYTDTAKENGNARFIRITDIGENGKLISDNAKYVELKPDNLKYELSKGDLLMARTGATYGKTMLFDENYPSLFASFLIKIIVNTNVILPEFYWHFAQSEYYWSQAQKFASKAGQPQFNANVLREVNVFVPPIQDQLKIVRLLDCMDKIVNDLSQGLPAEIAARRKQYEYYRNKLLTFKEVKHESV